MKNFKDTLPGKIIRRLRTIAFKPILTLTGGWKVVPLYGGWCIRGVTLFGAKYLDTSDLRDGVMYAWGETYKRHSVDGDRQYVQDLFNKHKELLNG